MYATSLYLVEVGEGRKLDCVGCPKLKLEMQGDEKPGGDSSSI